ERGEHAAVNRPIAVGELGARRQPDVRPALRKLAQLAAEKVQEGRVGEPLTLPGEFFLAAFSHLRPRRSTIRAAGIRSRALHEQCRRKASGRVRRGSRAANQSWQCRLRASRAYRSGDRVQERLELQLCRVWGAREFIT